MSDETMSEELVAEETRSPSRVVGGIPYLEQYLVLAERIARTEMVPDNLRGKPEAILAVVMYGAELGIGPMQALQQINFIKGKPSMSAELQRALVLEAGHQFIVTATRELATAQCKRKDWEEWQTTTFSIDDALLAGLLHKSDSGWAKYPDQMLGARVTSKACRMWFADVIAGMSYTPEEVWSFSTPPEVELEPMADAEDIDKLRTAIGMLDLEDAEKLTTQWKDALIPPISRGLTGAQCATALGFVDALLNATTDGDVVDAEIIGTEAAEALEVG